MCTVHKEVCQEVLTLCFEPSLRALFLSLSPAKVFHFLPLTHSFATIPQSRWVNGHTIMWKYSDAHNINTHLLLVLLVHTAQQRLSFYVFKGRVCVCVCVDCCVDDGKFKMEKVENR